MHGRPFQLAGGASSPPSSMRPAFQQGAEAAGRSRAPGDHWDERRKRPRFPRDWPIPEGAPADDAEGLQDRGHPETRGAKLAPRPRRRRPRWRVGASGFFCALGRRCPGATDCRLTFHREAAAAAH